MRRDELFRRLYEQRPEPVVRQCAHKRRFPHRDRDDQCVNVAEFGIVKPDVRAGSPMIEPVCGQCLAPVMKMLLRRYETVGVVNVVR